MLQIKLNITEAVYKQICDTIGRHKAETGGMLGSSDGGKTVTHFYFDKTATTSGATYSPDVTVLNKILADWNNQNIEFIGFIHSHPFGSHTPSNEDMKYVKKITKALGIDELFMPIVNVNFRLNGDIDFYPYTIDKKGNCRMRQVSILEDTPKITAPKIVTPIKTPYTQKVTPSVKMVNIPNLSVVNERFSRIKTLYPMLTMAQKTVICIGAGGTRGFIEELARSGIGNFILLDGDKVSATNIATQQVYMSEIGKFKVEALKERILDINPTAKITAIPLFLDDDMTDKEFINLLGYARYIPKNALICGCTDSFPAQARAASLALKLGIPYLAGQLYKNGMAAEVYFNYPGVTTGGCQAARWRAATRHIPKITKTM